MQFSVRKNKTDSFAVAHLEGPYSLNSLLTERKPIGKSNPSGSCYLLLTLFLTHLFSFTFSCFPNGFFLIIIFVSGRIFLGAQVTLHKILKSMLTQYSNTLQKNSFRKGSTVTESTVN